MTNVLILRGHATDLLADFTQTPDLVVTDPPYAFGGEGDEHAMSATVAVVLRESASRLRPGSWMLVMCASSWRSTIYVVEALRGVAKPVRFGTWCKPAARSRVRTKGWAWASVKVVAFRRDGREKTSQAELSKVVSAELDHITCAPIMKGRRAQLPPVVADWVIAPFAVKGGLLLDPFAGSGALLSAGERAGMRSTGFELQEV